MADNVTQPSDRDVDAYLDAVTPERRRTEARAVLGLMTETTGEPPVMWGPSMIGFGSVHYRYDSGREGDTFAVGFAPRKAALTVYLATEFDGRDELLAELGPHTTGASCLYIKRLDAVDLDVLRSLVKASYQHAVTVVDTGEGHQG